MRTYVRVIGGDDPARRRRRLLRVGRAARRPAAAGQADDRRRRGGARGELRGARVRGPRGDGRRGGAAAVPRRDRRLAALRGLRRREPRALRGLPADGAERRGLSGSRRRSSTSAGSSASSARRARSRSGCGARSASACGLPLSVGVARTKHLAKIASRNAKPDGLLVVEPRDEIAFLHPLPVEELWGVGPKTVGEAPRARDRDRRPARGPRRGDARLVPRPGRRPPAPRARQQPRPAARARQPAPALDRLAVGVRPPAEVGGRPRRDRRRPRRPGRPPDARGRARRAHDRAADPLQRLHAREPLEDAAAADRVDGAGSSRPSARCWRPRRR